MQEIEESEENVGKNYEEFKQFDVVTDVLDHHYAKKHGEGYGASKATKRIMQEWNILEKNLPESIYVRAYEGRIDLLRAVIVGAAGTPYHDGLFFFDLHFTPDYPAYPPEVYYHSFGLRINPNLYANGRVCLSLLNTWSGRKNERWNSKESTILQVLVSIQALVLNEKPYYNEPFIVTMSSWQHSEKKALSYNENTYMLNCMTMLYTLSKPLAHFEEFVSWHFRERAHVILTACKAYMEGCVRVGGLIENGSSSSSMNIDVSKKFKVSMEELYPKLQEMFMKSGASLGTFVKQIEVAKEKTISKPQEVVKIKDGFTKGAFKKVKKMLGLN